MAHTEPWQVFSGSGQPVTGVSASKEDFAHDSSLVMAAAQVWVWRERGDTVEILLQKRASDKASWPAYWDISAAGHLDGGEAFIEAAIRESKEEIGLALDPDRLFFAFSLRTPLDKQEIDIVYLYKLETDERFTFEDGEVEQLQWVTLGVFEDMVRNPNAHQLVPQGDEYFSLLVKLLKRIVAHA